MTAKTWDTRCQDLAEHFLTGRDPRERYPMSLAEEKEQTEDLAAHIQQAIEDWFTARENRNEAAYDRHQELLMEGGGGPSLIEQQQAAYKIKRGLR